MPTNTVAEPAVELTARTASPGSSPCQPGSSCPNWRKPEQNHLFWSHGAVTTLPSPRSRPAHSLGTAAAARVQPRAAAGPSGLTGPGCCSGAATVCAAKAMAALTSQAVGGAGSPAAAPLCCHVVVIPIIGIIKIFFFQWVFPGLLWSQQLQWGWAAQAVLASCSLPSGSPPKPDLE